MPGKTIKIFLPNGDPKNIRKASITTDKIEIIQIPRNIPKAWQDLNFNGIYVLVDSLRIEKPEIYIGKGDVRTRLSKHDTTKKFWNMVFAIRLIGDQGFNEAHTSYLEYYFIKKAKELNQAITKENHQSPQCPKLDEDILADLEYYIETIEILLPTMGLKCFQPMENKNPRKRVILSCSDNYGSKASGEYTDEGMFVYKGAICKKDLHRGTSHISIRDEMITDGQLKLKGNHYILQENKLFSSVSTASSVILGRRSNGWLDWKNDKGKTLDELERIKES